jgi:CelD/BcsL family acetyltransferase involved in cellulose biosynthesis
LVSQVQLNLITSEEGFRSLESEWNSLLQTSRANNIFLTWEWISTWWDWFGHGRQLWILIARNLTGDLVGLAPLNLHKSSLLPRLPILHNELSFLGANAAAPDHLDFIIQKGYEDLVALTFVDYMDRHSNWDILRLDGLISDSPLMPYMKTLINSWGNHFSQKKSAIARLPKSWDTFLPSLSKNLRKNIGRYSERLEKDYPGKVKFIQIDDEKKLRSAYLTLITLAKKVKELHGEKYSLDDQALQRFLEDVVILFHKRKWLRLYILNIDGENIAASICYHYNNVVSVYQSGYALSWKNYSPGHLIRAHCIKQAIIEKAVECDFLRGEHIYKNEWATGTKTNLYLKQGYSLLGKSLVTLYGLYYYVYPLFTRIRTYSRKR